MFKNVLRLKGINEDLLYFLKGIVEGCIEYIEKGGLQFERCLGYFKDIKKIIDDKELLRILKYRLSYVSKLRHHYFLYETNYNSNVSDLVGLEFHNRFFENIHFLECENFEKPTEDDCMCFNSFYQAIVKDVSNFVNKRYDVIMDLEDAYKDLMYDCEERLEEQEELQEQKELEKNEEVKIIEVENND